MTNPSGYYTSIYSGEEIDDAIGKLAELGDIVAEDIPISETDSTTIGEALEKKADKVSDAVSGNLASLSATGDLQDSGKKPEDFAPATVQSNMTLYVNASTGNDENDGLSAAEAKRTIQSALDSIPKNIGGCRVYINIAAGTYAEKVDIEGFYGGNYSIQYGVSLIGESADSVFITDGIAITGCRVPIAIKNMTVSGNNLGNCVSSRQSSFTFISGLKIDGSAAIGETVFFQQANGTVFNTQINNSSTSAVSAIESTLYINLVSGSSNSVGICSGSNASATPALVVVGSNTISADTRYQKIKGGAIIENGVLV